jgi:hypothetical protein
VTAFAAVLGSPLPIVGQFATASSRGSTLLVAIHSGENPARRALIVAVWIDLSFLDSLHCRAEYAAEVRLFQTDWPDFQIAASNSSRTGWLAEGLRATSPRRRTTPGCSPGTPHLFIRSPDLPSHLNAEKDGETRVRRIKKAC